MRTLLIEKIGENLFNHVLDIDGNVDSAIDSNPTTTAFGLRNYIDFKTKNGSPIIGAQRIAPQEITIEDTFGGTGTYTGFVDVLGVLQTLNNLGYYLGYGSGGGSGVTRFVELSDTPSSYEGSDGKVLIVNETQNRIYFGDFFNKRFFTDLDDVDSPEITLDLVGKMPAVANVGGQAKIVFIDMPDVDSSSKMFTQLGEITQDGNEITVSAGFAWEINNVPYSNAEDQVFEIQEEEEGIQRIDVIYTSGNAFAIIEGQPSNGVAVKPQIPNGSLELTSVNVSGSSISQPTNPISGDAFVSKVSRGIINYGGSGTEVKPFFDYAEGKVGYRLTNAGLVSLSGLTFANGTNQPILGDVYKFLVENTNGVLFLANQSSTNLCAFKMEDDLFAIDGSVVSFVFDGTFLVFDNYSLNNYDDLQAVNKRGNITDIIMEYSPSVNDFSDQQIPHIKYIEENFIAKTSVEERYMPVDILSLVDFTSSNNIYFNNYPVYTGNVSKLITTGTGIIQIHRANSDYSSVSFIESVDLGSGTGLKEIAIDVDLVAERIGVSASGGNIYYGAPSAGDVEFAESPDYALNNAIILGYGYAYLTDGLEARIDYLESNVSKETFVLYQKNRLKFQKSEPNFFLNGAFFFGRWFEKEISGIRHVCTVNQGAEFYTWIRGTSYLTALFTNISSSGNSPVVSVSVDGGDFNRVTISSSTTPLTGVSLASGLSTDDHLVRIVVSGLQESDNKWVNEIGLAFGGFLVATGGAVIPIKPSNKVIEFFGDSITEGINVLGTGANPSVNCAEKAFPFIATDILNCSNVRVGFGGTGVTHGGSGGMPKMLTTISLMTSTRFENAQSPDILVVNHGTNDSGATSEDFTLDYTEAIDKLQRNFPCVPIFCMRPFNGSFEDEISDIVNSYDNKNIYYVDTTDWGVTYSDGLHPDVIGGQVAGEKLAEFIYNELGKSFFIGQSQYNYTNLASEVSRSVSSTITVNSSTYQNNSLIGASLISMVVLNGDITQGPFTFNSATGTITMSVMATDLITVYFNKN